MAQNIPPGFLFKHRVINDITVSRFWTPSEPYTFSFHACNVIPQSISLGLLSVLKLLVESLGASSPLCYKQLGRGVGVRQNRTVYLLPQKDHTTYICIYIQSGLMHLL